MRFVAEGVPRLRVLQFGYRGNVARMEFRHCNVRLSLQQNNGSQALRRSLVHVERLHFRRQCARTDTKQRDPARERIGKSLENESGERFAVGDLSLNFFTVRVFAGNRALRGRIRQQVEDGIK